MTPKCRAELRHTYGQNLDMSLRPSIQGKTQHVTNDNLVLSCKALFDALADGDCWILPSSLTWNMFVRDNLKWIRGVLDKVSPLL